MKYNPAIHNRQSYRLHGFDYASERSYFLTLNTKNRQHLFGKIVDGKMILNDAGIVAHQCWLDIPKHFPHAQIHAFVIMPDHIHGIIELKEYKGNGRIGLFESPEKTIGSIVRGYKIGVTKWMRNNTVVYEVWQRGYYDHIIRNFMAFCRITDYIFDNPRKWKE
jgi:REP element-mobilizing transposase RayT